jgi:eukaryotic-like serine/threonine-protein kinase
MVSMTDIDRLNQLLAFCDFPFSILSTIVESGQRTVYQGISVQGNNVVIKISTFNEIKIGRIQREIRILSDLESEYFPRFYCHTYISKEVIDNFIDNLASKEKSEISQEFQINPIRPFFVTCEEFIENIGWSTFKKSISNERDLVEFAFHLFTALEILWERKIVHRDIKPDNILIKNTMRPVIIDLGIAKSLRDGTQNFTVLGIAPCTPQYAAPEQFETTSEVTYKADQFAVGVILYHLVTGKFPYGRYDELELDGLLKNFADRPPILPTEINKNLSVELAGFINRLLEIQPYC